MTIFFFIIFICIALLISPVAAELILMCLDVRKIRKDAEHKISLKEAWKHEDAKLKQEYGGFQSPTIAYFIIFRYLRNHRGDKSVTADKHQAIMECLIAGLLFIVIVIIALYML